MSTRSSSFRLDPKAAASPSQLLAKIKALGPLVPLARVETDDFTVEGPIIGLDQKTDKAWVDGPGTMTQLAPPDLLTEKGLDADGAARPSRRRRRTGSRKS